MSDLTSHEIQVLQMVHGTKTPEWGAWVSVCLETLKGRGYITHWPYKLTDKGRKYIDDMLRANDVTGNIIPDDAPLFPSGTPTGCKDRNGTMVCVGDKVRYMNASKYTKEEYHNPEYEVVFEAPTFTLKRIGGGQDPGSHNFILQHGGRNGDMEIFHKERHEWVLDHRDDLYAATLRYAKSAGNCEHNRAATPTKPLPEAGREGYTDAQIKAAWEQCVGHLGGFHLFCAALKAASPQSSVEETDYKALFEECQIARDETGFLGSVPECIRHLSSVAKTVTQGGREAVAWLRDDEFEDACARYWNAAPDIARQWHQESEDQREAVRIRMRAMFAGLTTPRSEEVVEKIEKARRLFSEIRGDFTDPRSECREGADILTEVLAALHSPADRERK